MAYTMNAGVPQIDFSPLANLGKTYRDAQLQQNRRESLQALQNGAPVADVARSLLAAGDLEGGMTLARLGEMQAQREASATRDARDFAFREQEAQRAQSNADRSFGFQNTQADRAQGNADRTYQLQKETANPAQIVTVEQADGSKVPVRVDRQGNATAINVPGMNSGPPTNPYATGKMTEAQNKDALYASRMFNAEKVLRDPSVIEGATSYKQAGIESTPFVPSTIKNWAHSEGYQKFDQAKRDFVNAVLRRESGAAISESEFQNAEKQYFPQPGDSAAKIAQKQQNRVEAIKGFAGGAGKGYTPRYIFAPDGKIVDNPALAASGNATVSGTPAAAPAANPAAPAPTPAAAGQLPQGVTKDAALAQARAAIAAGRDPEGVKAKLKSFGIDPEGL